MGRSAALMTNSAPWTRVASTVAGCEQSAQSLGLGPSWADPAASLGPSRLGRTR